jgi:serine/threonine protein kinase
VTAESDSGKSKLNLVLQDPVNPGALNRKMMQKIVNVEYTYPPNIHLSPEFKDLMARIFTKDPKSRIKIPEMSQHPW